MKKHFYITNTLVLFFLLIANSCTKESNYEKKNPNFDFTYTSACGWCAGSYELRIVNNLATFEYHAVCDNQPRTFERELTNKEIEDLNLSDLYAEIKLLNIDNCGVCYDGCDEKLQFNEGENEYFIRFTNDKEVTQLVDYIETIRNIFDKMNNKSLEE